MEEEKGRTEAAYLPLSQSIKDSLLDLISMVIKTHMLQHHHAAQQQRSRVRKGLASNIRRGAVNGLEDRALVADIARGSKTKATDKAGAHIGEDIAVEIWHDEDLIVVRGRVSDDLQTRVIEQLGVEFDIRKILADFTRDAEEQAVGHLHDGSLVDGADLPLANVLGVLKREAEDALRGGAGDEFDALDDAVDDDVLDAGVFAFGVLADEGDVDVVVGGLVAGDGLAGPHVGEEVEGAAEGEVQGDVAFADGCLVARVLVGCVSLVGLRGDGRLEGLSALRGSS